MQFEELDDMSKEELKRELMVEKFDELRRPELVEKIAEEFGLTKGDYSYGTINVSGLKKIYIDATDLAFEDLNRKTGDAE